MALKPPEWKILAKMFCIIVVFISENSQATRRAAFQIKVVVVEYEKFCIFNDIFRCVPIVIRILIWGCGSYPQLLYDQLNLYVRAEKYEKISDM